MGRLLLLLSVVALHQGTVSSLPEQGIWNVDVSQSNHIAFFTKTMFVNSSVYLKIVCDSPDPNLQVIVSWVLRYSPCADEFAGLTPNLAFGYLSDPNLDFFRHRYKKSEYKMYQSPKSYLCSKHSPIILEDSMDSQKVHQHVFPPTASSNKTKSMKNSTVTAKTAKAAKSPKPAGTKTRKKRAASKVPTPRIDNSSAILNNDTVIEEDETDPPTNPPTDPPTHPPTHPATNTNTPATTATKQQQGEKDELAMYKTATTWADGAYLLVLNIQMERQKKGADKQATFDAKVTVWMKSSYGYLSAIEWPFLIFYGVMCLVYLAYAIAWTILSACHWRDILRVQFWIGAVILLGMLEKAMFYAEYQSINSTGQSVRGAVIFAEFISCIKRTLARLLLMVVSIGYGIVKPRLGPALIKVVVIGIAYFIFALIEGCIRVLWSRFDMPRIILLVQVPLALTDAIILWWTFTYLVQTIQQMRLRRNIVKFNLYKHFSNILILVVGVSIIFMGWSVFYQKWFQCKRHWREIWVDDAFWHILFSVILLVIIWLWRPSKNNQRYAYSPVLDADDDADEDILMDNLVSGELSKKLIHSENGTTKRDSNKSEDDLRWVEEHIPKSTAAENVFPLVDSDEEIATTKLHLSKME